jgi:hypothetical protein
VKSAAYISFIFYRRTPHRIQMRSPANDNPSERLLHQRQSGRGVLRSAMQRRHMDLDPARPNELQSLQVIVRFTMRIVLLTVLSAFIGRNFGYVMLLVSVLLCILCGMVRRERPLGDFLTYWDEAAVYGALFCLASMVQAAGDA